MALSGYLAPAPFATRATTAEQRLLEWSDSSRTPEGEGQQRGWGEFEAERELDAPRGDYLPRIGKEAK